MKSLPSLITHLAGFCLCLGSFAVSAQTQRYVVIDNMPAVAGQSQVGSSVAIPIDSAVDAQLDADGNFVFECKKGLDAPPTGCSNIGAGAGTAPAAPSVTVTAPTAAVAASGAKITWTSIGADACYGVSATTATVGAPAVSGWTKEWSKSNATGFSLDGIYGAMAAGSTASYDFTLRCYSTATGTSGQTSIVAYQDRLVQVNFDKPQGGGGTTGDWCSEYLDTLSQAERDNFNTYRADNRGFSVKDVVFSEQTGKILGTSPAGPVGPAPAPVLPGKQAQAQYHAMSFSLPQTGGSDGFTLLFGYKNSTGAPINHNAIATISPCRGDFRPLNPGGTDAYTRAAQCRTTYDIEGKQLIGSRELTDNNACPIPPGKTMYINVSVRNLYDLQEVGNSVGTYPICEPTKYCGKGTDVFLYDSP